MLTPKPVLEDEAPQTLRERLVLKFRLKANQEQVDRIEEKVDFLVAAVFAEYEDPTAAIETGRAVREGR